MSDPFDAPTSFRADLQQAVREMSEGRTRRRDDLLVEGDGLIEHDWVDHHGKYRSGPPPLDGFLLARFAEDQRDVPILFDTVERVGGYFIDLRERYVADIDAKRRIVERLARITEADDGCVCDRCMTLRDLALPYADHPDYRPEWKPDL